MRLAIAALALQAACAATAQTPANPWQVEAGGGVERLSNGTPDWRQVDLALRRRMSDGAQLELATREARRYGQRDSELALGASLPVSAANSIGLRASAAGRGNFLPRAGAQIEIGHRPGGGWGLSVLLDRKLYDTGSSPATGTSLLQLGVERYVGAWRVSAGANHARLDGGQGADGARIQLDHYIGDGGRIGVLASGGRELESAPGGVISTRVDSVAVLGRWPLAPAWALTGELARHRVGGIVRGSGASAISLPGAYSRSAVRLGVQHGF